MELDRLRALPDCLLFQILDRLGFKEAARTALLSKQWRFLWTNLPLAFSDETENLDEIGSFVAGVHAALAVRRGPALDSLLFVFQYYDSFASDVDSWLDFAAKIEVRNLSLYLERNPRKNRYALPPIVMESSSKNCGAPVERNCGDSDPRKNLYALPQIIYSNPSLTELNLKNCTAPAPDAAVEWRCLRKLSMEYVKLPQRAIDGIISGCPALETLDLHGCIGFKRLEIGGRCFRRLNVSYCYLEEISARYMRDLQILIYCSIIRRGKLRVQNAPYLERAQIDFYARSRSRDEKFTSNAFNLFEDLRHVRTLELSPSSIEVVSMMATSGRQFPGMKVEDLQVYGASDVHGVIAMLESCPYLEKLVVGSSYWPKEEVDWGIIRRDLNCELMQVKFEEILDSDEATLTLLQIVLKRAPFLEKLIYATRHSSREECNEIKRTLMSYPRSSQNVSIEIF